MWKDYLLCQLNVHWQHPILLREMAWKYFMPLICLLGLVANLINVAVFSNRRKLKNSIYKYLQSHATAELVYFGIAFVHFATRLTLNTGFEANRLARLYQLYVYLYLNTAFSVYLMLLEILITLKRLFIIANTTKRKRAFKFDYFLKLFLLFLVSLLVCGPMLLHKSVNRVDIKPSKLFVDTHCVASFNLTQQSTATAVPFHYALKTTSIGNEWAFKLVMFLLFILRGFFLPLVFLFINILIIRKFKQQLQKRAKIKRIPLVTLNQQQISSKLLFYFWDPFEKILTSIFIDLNQLISFDFFIVVVVVDR